jgi:hypothetical protein
MMNDDADIMMSVPRTWVVWKDCVSFRELMELAEDGFVVNGALVLVSPETGLEVPFSLGGSGDEVAK